MQPLPSDTTATPAPAAFRFVEQLAHDLSRGTVSLPSFPDAIVRIQNALSDPRASTADVALAVQAEPAFAARMFRMANSVMLRRGDNPVSDLHAVVNRLGFATVRNFAVALATRQIMSGRQFRGCEVQLRELWEHNLTTAALASMIARHTRAAPPHDAMLAGLLHDIGVVYIYARLSAHRELCANPDTVRWILDDWHTTVGRAILEEWDFPITIVEAIDEHEQLERSPDSRADLVDVLVLANILAHCATGQAAQDAIAKVPSLGRLGLTPEDAARMLDESRREVELLKQAMA